MKDQTATNVALLALTTVGAVYLYLESQEYTNVDELTEPGWSRLPDRVLAEDMSLTIVSMMALTAPPAPGMRVVEWPGVQATPKTHPSWASLGDSLRNAEGALLPALRLRYGISGAVAGAGFSAGSNSGMRALLKSQLDRAELDWAACIDGLHVDRRPGDVQDQELAPFVAYALSAARGQKRMVATASSVAAPVGRTGSTEAWAMVVDELAGHGVAFDEADWAYSVPGVSYAVQSGGLLVAFGPGSDAKAHIEQGRVTGPELIRRFIVERENV